MDMEEHLAHMATSPIVNAAATILPWSKAIYSEPNTIVGLIGELSNSTARMADGDMKAAEAMMFNQAQVLQMIFTNLATRAVNQQYLSQMQTFLNLGLKAQAQCRATLEALAEMKNPRQVAFVKQANIAGGNQQVNNAVLSSPFDPRSRAEENESRPNKLLLERTNAAVDIGGTGTASCTNTQLETVAKIDRAENKKR